MPHLSSPSKAMAKSFLTDEQVVRLNQELEREGFSERLVNDREPKFVVGEILEMVAHPDSDHLNICQVAVGVDKTVQIVAGLQMRGWV